MLYSLLALSSSGTETEVWLWGCWAGKGGWVNASGQDKADREFERGAVHGQEGKTSPQTFSSLIHMFFRKAHLNEKYSSQGKVVLCWCKRRGKCVEVGEDEATGCETHLRNSGHGCQEPQCIPEPVKTRRPVSFAEALPRRLPAARRSMKPEQTKTLAARSRGTNTLRGSGASGRTGHPPISPAALLSTAQVLTALLRTVYGKCGDRRTKR